MYPKSISMIQKQLMTYFKVKYVSILIYYFDIFLIYYKSHGAGIGVI